MNKVVVSIDFSATARHAAHFAARMLTGKTDVHLVLYHHFSEEGEDENKKAQLGELRDELIREYKVVGEVVAHQGKSYHDDFDWYLRHNNVTLLVMGITGRGAMGQAIFGSNTLRMAEANVCPVLIVPEGAAIEPVEQVVMAADFKNSKKTIPAESIRSVLDMLQPTLHIVNVDPGHYIAITESYKAEMHDLHEMFADYHPEFHFMRLYDVKEALELFTADKHIDVILAIRKHHSFFDRIFRESHTKSLAYGSKLPILVVHA